MKRKIEIIVASIFASILLALSATLLLSLFTSLGFF